jgi:hypothetical protein
VERGARYSPLPLPEVPIAREHAVAQHNPTDPQRHARVRPWTAVELAQSGRRELFPIAVENHRSIVTSSIGGKRLLKHRADRQTVVVDR